MTSKTMALAESVNEYVVAFRRELHRHPELSMEEFETTKKIAAELDKMGISYRLADPTGVIAEVEGTAGKSSKCVMLRGDIDALPVLEQTGLDFKSETDGKMHACGHDAHTAILLGAAKILNGMRDQFSGKVRFLFQPGEESLGGATALIAQGGMDGVTMGFGLHMDPEAPVGRVSLRSGPAFAAPARFVIKVDGRSCAGALPHTGVDALVAGAAIVLNLQSIAARELNPAEPLVVSPCVFHSGDRFNIGAGHAVIEGTYRTFNKDTYEYIAKAIERIAKDTAAAYRCTATFTRDMTGEVMVNDPAATEYVHRAVTEVNGDDKLYHVRGYNMGSEDFAFYSNVAPCAYFFLGAGGNYPLHHEKACFEEGCFKYGVAMFVQLAMDVLNGNE